MEFEKKELNDTENATSFEKLVVESANEKKIDAQEFGDVKIEEIEKSSIEFGQKLNQEFQEICEKNEIPEELMVKYESKLKSMQERISAVANIAKRKISQVVIGASMLLATAQSVEAAGLKLDIEKSSEKIDVEFIRKDLINHVSSPEYLAKLKIEFFGDAKLALDEQQARIENLKSVKVNLKETLQEVNVLFQNDGSSLSENLLPAGFYDELTHEIISINNDPSTLKHELLHASTKNKKGITSSAKKVLHKTFFGRNGYLRNPTEWLVRKQKLDLELAQKNIKEYGKPFTQSQYDIMMKMFHERKFSNDVMEFISVTDGGFESFKKILDEVAKNENGDDVKSV